MVQLVKDCGKKLTNTINLKNKPFPQVPGVPPAQVIVPNILLPVNAPPGSQWGLVTALQNAGAGAPNAPTVNSPGPAQFQPTLAAGLYQIPPPPPNPQGPIQLPLPVSGNPGPSGCAAQNMPPPTMPLSNCSYARLLEHSKYQVLHWQITHNKCFLRSW